MKNDASIFNKPIRFFITNMLTEKMTRESRIKNQVENSARLFSSGDFGEVPEEDAEQNLADIKNRHGHVLGMYKTDAGNIYIDLKFNNNKPEDIAMIMLREEY